MELMKELAEPERGLCQQQVIGMMGDLEQQKGQGMTLTDIEGRAYCEEFAIRLFGRLDSSEKGGGADKKMAQHFLVASTFFEILRQFDGDLDEKMQEMQTYSAWKAAQIVKAIKRGEVAPPGPPGWVAPAPAEGADLQEINLFPAPPASMPTPGGFPSLPTENPFPQAPLNEPVNPFPQPPTHVAPPPAFNPFPQPPTHVAPPPALDDFGLPAPPVGMPGVIQPAVEDGLQNAYIKPPAPFAQMVAPPLEPPPQHGYQHTAPPNPPVIQPTVFQLRLDQDSIPAAFQPQPQQPPPFQPQQPPRLEQQPAAAGVGIPKSFARNGSMITSLGYTWDQLCGIVEAEKDARAALRLLGAGHEDVAAALVTLKRLLPVIEGFAAIQHANNTGNNAA